MDDIDDLLLKTSRTFALTIPLLPEPTRSEVGVAYLLFRIIDTFEDAVHWTPEHRIAALGQFAGLLDGPPEAATWMVEACAREPPVDHAGYRELLAKMPAVLRAFQGLQPGAREPIRKHLARSADGMSGFVSRAVGPNGLELQTVDDLRDYCYAVAGIVGEMLTELFLLGRPALAPIAEDLRNRAAQFGEGLQLVNILKDARPDAAEGRIFLPRTASSREIFALADDDLAAAGDYTEMLRTAGAERGLVGFNAFIIKLAVATLQVLRERGQGAKLSRLQVAKIAAEVTHAIGQGRPLFEQRGLSIAG
jgi:farnesyl-diphosphate farnesyltransferase